MDADDVSLLRWSRRLVQRESDVLLRRVPGEVHQSGCGMSAVGEASALEGRPMIACPRCPGQMFYAVDKDGPYWQCLACGHIVENGLSQAQAVAEMTQKDGEKRAYPPKHGKMRL